MLNPHNPVTADLLRDPDFVDLSCLDKGRFKRHTDESLFACYDRIAAVRVSKSERERLESVNGLNINPHGILAHLPLRPFVRPISHTCADFAHTYLIDGCLTWDVWRWLKVIRRECNIRFSDIREYLGAFVWPRYSRSKLDPKSAFSDVRESSCMEADKLKMGASELLTVYPALRRFAEKALPRDKAVAERQSMLLGFKVIDTWIYLQGREDATERSRLDTAITEHIRMFEATTTAPLKLKHHKALAHLTDHLVKRRRLIWCLGLERKHKKLKSFLAHTCATKGFEESVTRSFMNEQMHHLQSEDAMRTGPRLVRARPASQELALELGGLSATMANTIVCGEQTYSLTDVVFFWNRDEASQVAIVGSFVQVDGTPFAIITPCARIDEDRWAAGTRVLAVALERLVSPCVWTRDGEAMLVLTPPKLMFPR